MIVIIILAVIHVTVFLDVVWRIVKYELAWRIFNLDWDNFVFLGLLDFAFCCEAFDLVYFGLELFSSAP